MKRIGKLIGIGLISCLLLGLVSMCVAAADGETIRVAMWSTNNKDLREKMMAVIEEKYPELDIQLEDMTSFGDYMSRLLTQMAAGNAPDVIEMNVENFPDFARRGAFAPLDPYISRGDIDIEDFFERPLKVFSYDGHQYGLPRSFSTVALFYNKDLFTEAGLPLPAVDTFLSWEEYIDYGKALTKGEGAQRQYGVTPGVVMTDFVGAYIPGMGGTWINDQKTEVYLDTPEAIEAVERVAALFHEHKVSPSFTTLTDQQGALVMFQTGRIGMFLSGPWQIPRLRQVEAFEWDVMHLPVMKQPATPFFANMVGISSGSKNKDAAWKFVKAWTSDPDVQALRAEHLEEIPPIKSVAYSPAFLGNTPPDNIQVFLDAVEYAQPVQSPNWSEIRFGIGPRYLEAVWLGDMTAEEAMKNIHKEVNSLF